MSSGDYLKMQGAGMRVSNASFEHIYELWSLAFVTSKYLNCFFGFVGFCFGFFFFLFSKGCKGVSQKIGTMALANVNSLCE